MTQDYKNTLNLPHTTFPMKANLPNRESEQLAFWQTINLYQQVRNTRQGCEKFFLHDGPPYANGQIHLGHAVNKILKDVVTKSHLLDGYDSPYIPGWDCHGLPIEVNVEKKHGKAGVKVSHKEFRELCRKYAKQQIDAQKKDFIRLGIIGDWDNPYMTMDYHIEANTVRALSAIIKNGYFRRGYKPVHWCFDCKSALAEAEIEYKDKTSDAIDVFFPMAEQSKVLELFDVSSSIEVGMAIWTTTAWTIPANRALSIHPDFDYQLVRTRVNNTPVGLIMAEQLNESCKERWGKHNDWEVLASGISGKAFEKMKALHPLYDRYSLCILGKFVTLETGTGIVHSAPAYGQDDFVAGQRYQLKIDNPVLDNGVYTAELPLYGNMHINKANSAIVEQLSQNGKLIYHEQLVHSYPHCWRHKTPTIQRATPQWFIGMEQNKLSTKVLDAIRQVNWIPSWGEDRMRSMIDNRPDWCISRQRSWGTPITILLHKDTGELHPRTNDLMEQIAKRISRNGIEEWFALKVEDILPNEEAKDYKKCTDTLDVWFDSGTTHYTVMKQREELLYPANIYLEGSDQHRGWFQSSLISAVAMNETAPYKAVMTHGFTVDSNGRKMSKSLGNTISPQEIVNQLGADVLRLWVASTDCSSEMTLSHGILQQSSDTYRRIRNTIRFLLANTHDFKLEKDAVNAEYLVAIDAWAIENARQLQQRIIANYAQYNYALALHSIYNFCASDLGSFYLDIIKDRIYTAKNDSLSRRSAQTALWYILEAMCRWIAPVLSFTAEEVWRAMPQRDHKTIFAALWYEIPQIHNMAIQLEDWQQLKRIKDKVNKNIERYRENNKSGSALDLRINIRANSNNYNLLSQIQPELHFFFICSQTSLEKLPDTARDEQDNLMELDCILQPCVHNKCVRCWQRLPEVGKIKEYPELCQRCVNNLHEGEHRQFV